MNRLMFTHCLRFLRGERRLWSPWKLWLANGGCFLPDRMTCCLLRWALKLAVGVSTRNFNSSKKKKKKKKAGTRKSALQTNYFCTGSLVTLSLGFLYELRHQIHNTRTMFKYVAAVLVINNNSNFKLKLQVKCLAL